MGHRLIRHKSYYIVWSTVVDAPVYVWKTESELLKWWKEEYGRRGLTNLNLEIEAYGGIKYETLYDYETCNRAGKDESELTVDEIYRAYCLEEELNGWSPYND